jgi:tetratricopeptide (TPR) repeat protein
MAEKALADCDKAIQLNRDYSDAYNNRGRVRVQARLYAEAVEDFDRQVDLLARMAERAGSYGVTLCVKAHVGACIDSTLTTLRAKFVAGVLLPGG